MASRVTIVMYHYVRDPARSRFPALKALSVDAFRGQLEYLRRHYTVVSMEEILDALARGGRGLPPNAALLTFDDGYAEHFTTVLPLLADLGMQGSFFPPARPVLEHRVLDVNKIHFVLASVPDATNLVVDLIAAVDARRDRFRLHPGVDYWNAFADTNRFDSREVTFVKRMLQRTLPRAARSEIVDQMFRQHVTADEDAFARELYTSLDQLRTMHDHGMFIGSHGYCHEWLDALEPAEQAEEVDRGIDFLRRIQPDLGSWVMCYPYGGFDDSLLAILRARGCAAGLSVEVGIADLAHVDPLLLPRLDTNDLPRDGAAQPERWALEGKGTSS